MGERAEARAASRGREEEEEEGSCLARLPGLELAIAKKGDPIRTRRRRDCATTIHNRDYNMDYNITKDGAPPAVRVPAGAAPAAPASRWLLSLLISLTLTQISHVSISIHQE